MLKTEVLIAFLFLTRLYEFFEGGNINTITTSPDELVRRTNQATFSDLRKSEIHQAFGEFVVHTCIVAVLPRRVEKAASRSHLFTFALSLLGMSALPPRAGMCSTQAYVRFVPISYIAPGYC